MGGYGAVWLVLALVLALLWRRPSLFVWVACAEVAAELVSSGLRVAIDRPRPTIRHAMPEPLVHIPSSPSLPSGHASTSFACATMLAVAAPRLALYFLLLAAAIAASRVYVGAHYPLDVLAGAALGVAIAAALTALRRLVEGRRRSPPERR
jgi:undecaprenyl-diphosphatase